jgi:hypothetical protein
MTDAEHVGIVEQAKSGKLLVGVDRPTARKVFTDLTVSRINEKTGYAPYLEKSIVLSLFVLGPLALVTSVVIVFFEFGWWGLVSIVAFPVLYLLYYGMSARGGAGPYMISALLLASIGLYVLGDLQPAFIRPAIVFIFALWCGRMMYVFAAFFYRAMAIRSAKLFEFLSAGIVLKRADSLR